MDQHDLVDDRPRTGRSAKLVQWRAMPDGNPSLLGYADINFGGWIIRGIPVFLRSSGEWSVGVPSVPQVTQDNRVKVGQDGKRLYLAMLDFATSEDQQRYRRMVLTALQAGGVGNGP
jgi:hypothetical protein